MDDARWRLELRQARLLREAGFMVDEYPNREKYWFVGLGSHGGSGKTLRRAVKRCLRCCNLKKWWKMKDGRLAKDVARKVMNETPIEGYCDLCGMKFTTTSASYSKEKPYRGRCPSCTWYGVRMT